jgi:hypothetical protein
MDSQGYADMVLQGCRVLLEKLENGLTMYARKCMASAAHKSICNQKSHHKPLQQSGITKHQNALHSQPQAYDPKDPERGPRMSLPHGASS